MNTCQKCGAFNIKIKKIQTPWLKPHSYIQYYDSFGDFHIHDGSGHVIYIKCNYCGYKHKEQGYNKCWCGWEQIIISQ